MVDVVVDVVLPAFNAAGTIGAAIRSIQRQTVDRLHIVVVDDGSRDDTASIATSLAAEDRRIVVVRQEQTGIVGALNEALRRGTAPYVARQDADDLSDPDRLEKQISHLARHQGVVALSGAHREIDAEGRPTGRTFQPEADGAIDPAWVPAREPRLTQPFMMVRRAAIETIGGYRPFPVSEDTDLYWRLRRLGTLDILSDIVGSYRMHPGSISSASIRSGRMMAVCSQLAALSAQRVAAGASDLAIPPLSRASFEAAGDLEPMIRLAAPPGLSDAERQWLELAVAGKLMELAGYRPYELERSDCEFIGRMFGGRGLVSKSNRRELERMFAATAARMVRLRRWQAATDVAPLRLWPQVGARAATGRLYWNKHLA